MPGDERFPTPMSRWTRHRARVVVLGGWALIGACSEPVGVVRPDPLEPSLPAPQTRSLSGIQVRSETVLLRSDAVVARIVLLNRGPEPRALRFPDTCVATLRAYFQPSGGLAWDQRQGKTRCREQPLDVRLAPGDSLVTEAAASAMGILGFNLPAGPYRMVAILRPSQTPALELDLGIARLQRPDR